MTTNTNTKPARTTRIPNQFVSDGGVRQEGSLPLYECNACKREVVWATSARTGRKYLVNVTRNQNDKRFYVKNMIHTCTPGGEAFAVVVIEADRKFCLGRSLSEAETLEMFNLICGWQAKDGVSAEIVMVRVETAEPKLDLESVMRDANYVLTVGKVVKRQFVEVGK